MSRPGNGAVSLPRFLFALVGVGVLSTLATPVSDEGSVPALAPAEAGEPPSGLTRDDWSQIRRSIRQSEYRARRVAKPGEAALLQAPNRQQQYRTTFRRDGIEIVRQGPAGASYEELPQPPAQRSHWQGS